MLLSYLYEIMPESESQKKLIPRIIITLNSETTFAFMTRVRFGTRMKKEIVYIWIMMR